MFVFTNIFFKFLIFYPHFPTFYQQNLYFILFFITQVRDKCGLERHDSDADIVSGDHGRGRLMRF